MTEIHAMLKTRGVMPLNEFHAAACAMIPAEATRYGRVSRMSVVRVWLHTYRRRIAIHDGQVEYRQIGEIAAEAAGARGPKMLAVLKAQGRISREESGFKRQTWNSYSRALRRLKWAVLDGPDRLQWCGPDDAAWVTVTRENSGDKRRGKQCD